MNDKELDKIIDQGLIRLKKKAELQENIKQAEKLLFPRLKAIFISFLFLTIIYTSAYFLYLNASPYFLFNLVFWSFPIFSILIMIHILVNYGKAGISESFLTLLFLYMIFLFVGHSLWARFLTFVINSGYVFVVPVVDYKIQLF